MRGGGRTRARPAGPLRGRPFRRPLRRRDESPPPRNSLGRRLGYSAMARAAAKRRQPTHHHRDDRRHKDSGGQRFEDTLFFNRLRKRAKWVFIFLAVVFAGGFVLFGVGSSNVSGLSDIFNGIGGGSSGQPSVSKALKETQKDPKNAQAWHNLATAYDTNG